MILKVAQRTHADIQAEAQAKAKGKKKRQQAAAAAAVASRQCDNNQVLPVMEFARWVCECERKTTP